MVIKDIFRAEIDRLQDVGLIFQAKPETTSFISSIFRRETKNKKNTN